MSKHLGVIAAFLIIALSGSVQVNYFQLQKNGQLKLQINDYKQANKSLEQGLIDLSEQIAIADKVNKKSEENRKYLNRQLINSKQKITELGEQNETIENYLDTPIPDELFNLLREGGSNHKGGTTKSETTVKPVIAH